MSIGGVVTKDLLDQKMYQITNRLAMAMREIEELHDYLLATPDSFFTTTMNPPYTAGEIATVKSAFVNDGGILTNVYKGLAALPAAQDFRLNLMQLAGTRVTD